MKTSKKKKILISAIAIVLLWVIIGLTLASHLGVNMYTTEQHINRISKRLEKKYMQSGEYTDYKVYPLYKADGDVKYEYSIGLLNRKHKDRFFLVEFEPKGYFIVLAMDELFHSMYKIDYHSLEAWSRYRISEQRPDDIDGIHWAQIRDDMGKALYDGRWYEYDAEIVVHYESPYKVANIGQEEKKYLLPIGGKGDMTRFFIPAVKRGDKFLNLISMEEFYYDPNATYETTPCRQVSFYKQYDIAVYL